MQKLGVSLGVKYYVKELPLNMGNTPIRELKSEYYKKISNIFLKLEYNNPTGSIKDRSVFGMIEGLLEENKHITNPHFVIPSSGNAGISLAYLCSLFNYKCTVFCSGNIEESKCHFINLLGGDVKKCNGEISTEPGGWIYEAKKFANEKGNRIYIDQFDCKYNSEIHKVTTAPEIFNYFIDNEIELDYIFVGVGSGGTAEGILDFIVENNLNTKMVVIEPIGGMMYGAYHNIPTKYIDHNIESLSDSFVPANILNVQRYADVKQYTDDTVEESTKNLLKFEGIFAGEATAFVLHSALEYLKENKILNKNILILATDSGQRYL